MKALWNKIGGLVDIRDAIFAVGLGLLFYGLWLFDPAFAFTGAGAVLLFMTMRR